MATQFKKYLIGPTDQFDPVHYPSIDDEILIIIEKTHSFPLNFKIEILISFLKDHSIQNKWIGANPELTKLVTSQTLFVGSIESLFDSCRNNPVFRKDLEAYLKERFTGNMHL